MFGSGVRRVVSVAALAFAAAVVPAVEASAEGHFTCRAAGSPLLAGSIANPQNSPCQTDDVTAQESQNRGLVLSSTSSRTYLVGTPANRGRSEVTVGRFSILDTGLLPHPNGAVAGATAEASCVGGQVQFSGSSYIHNTAPLPHNDFNPFTNRVDLPLGLVTLHLNWRGTVNGEFIARALWLEIPGLALANDVVVAEARAGAVGNPCAP